MRAFVVAVLLAAGCARPQPVTPVQTGTMTLLEGEADLDGQRIGTTEAPATIVVVLASWCEHCREELKELAIASRGRNVRLIGVNYRGHEEYDHRGGKEAIRRFAHALPWIRIVPINNVLFGMFGSPPLIPAVYVFDKDGNLVESYDRRERKPPDRIELYRLFERLGA